MAKGTARVIGLTLHWRHGSRHDSLRAFVFQSGKTTAVSAKVHPTLKQINLLLKSKLFRKDQAVANNQFQALQQRLQSELQSELGLKSYNIVEKLELARRQFDFSNSIEEFTQHKSDTGIAYNYRSTMLHFWMPFFLSKNCEHPRDFKQWKNQALLHIKNSETIHGEKYSHHSYCGLTKPLNEYMRFLRVFDYIGDADVFSLNLKITLEQKKRGEFRAKRSSDTYTLSDLFEIKKKIDATYANDLQKKARAYALYLGLCTGLRRGNFMGLKVGDLFHESKTPHFKVTDNVLPGWSRGKKGVVIFENSTKTTSDEDGALRLPMIQPSREIFVEVASFLKSNMRADDRLIDAHPDSVGEFWLKTSDECGFKFLNPLQWRHSYATIGATNLHTLYKGNIYFLQQCCLHSSVKTTERYVNLKSSELLKAFETV